MDNKKILIKTASADIEILLKFKIVNEIEKICSFENKMLFSKLCKENCKNYNAKWSCPPFSPSFKVHSSSSKKLVLFLLNIELNQMNYIKNNYLKVKAANVILKSRIEKFLRQIIVDNEGKILSTGSCRLCKPCMLKKGLSCRNPEKMGFSLEALGLDVEKLSIEIFNHKLLWYKKGELPAYTSVLAGVLLNEDIDDPKIEKCIINFTW